MKIMGCFSPCRTDAGGLEGMRLDPSSCPLLGPRGTDSTVYVYMYIPQLRVLGVS